ncbi:MAG: hypothetical protein JSV88_05840 [Candidatus Aminicenantes bacterium]|nr:MAG: hypothetical protein JSV88_05840 [Candidatus Aminicenantes bacterium]
MKSKRVLKIFLVVFLAATLVYIFSGIKGKNQPDFSAELSADGEGMQLTCWAMDKVKKGLRKALVIKCSESIKESEDKIVMKNIEGNIFKKGHMNKDIKVFGDQGFVENNYHSFFVEKNARLVSEDFIITSQHFTLEDQVELHSASKVYYQTESLKGTALGGMGLYLNVNTLKFYDTKGTYKHNNQVFDYQTKVWWLIEKEKVMVLEKEAIIKDEKSILRSDWLTLRFSDDFKQLQEASAQKNSYLYAEDKEKNEIKEIKAKNITSLYDTEGHLTHIKTIKNSEILVESETHRTLIAADIVEMSFDGPSGKAKDLKIPLRGIIENTGKTRFKVIADTIFVQYNKAGEIRRCEAEGEVEFIVEDYKGVSDKIVYNIERDSIDLEGEPSQIENKNNTFTSSEFKGDVEKKILSSNAGVKSLIFVEKENALFSTESIYINSGKFTIFEKERKFKYERQVNLNQKATLLSANSLEIGEDGAVSGEGRVSLSFKTEDKEVDIKGDRLTFDPEKKRIEIIDNAVIKNDENILRAARFEVQFNDKNEIDYINGEEDIYFTKEDLSGTSRRVQWFFNQEVLILKGSPQVVNRSGHKTLGKELKINLQNNKITILSDESERTETIIR